MDQRPRKPRSLLPPLGQKAEQEVLALLEEALGSRLIGATSGFV